MVEDLNKTPKIYNEKAKNAFELIKKEIKTLPFSPNHLIHKNNKIEKLTVKLLESRKIIEAYPPLVDRPVNRRVCKVAQFEHTLYLTENGKKIVSKGEDY
ncbi:MAP2 [Hepatospora eriocheir]|uniref:MAP2 n=1 Tax=Hepatospora eriocheir TaxID=1081669 RepID=A0A1X0Q6H4_9MICR|nr:MAP2 [Hepatospora eriocheir]